MSDMPPVPGTASTTSAGQQLRAAREASGLHIVALAAALKVPVRKLEALEANRWDELTDATFVRALAGSVARHLRIDAGPILLALPAGKTVPIEVPDNLGRASGANVQFGMSAGIPKVIWFVVALLVAALTMYLLPDTLIKRLPGRADSTLAVETPAATQSFPGRSGEPDATSGGPSADGAVQGKGVIEQPDVPGNASQLASDSTTGGVAAKAENAPPVVEATSLTGAANVVPAGAVSSTALIIKATADTWIEVNGQDGKMRAQRLLKQGDTAEFDDSGAFAVVLGNAAGAKVWVKGSEFDLGPVTRNNIARFDAK